jgi:hypothetical protein
MSIVYVANASLQRHEFTYRIPGQSRTRTIPIPAMSQVRIPEDIDDMMAFADQHEPYGFVGVDALKSMKIKSQVKLLFRVGSPISSEMIQSLYNLNRGFLDEFGKKLRMEAAIASNALVNKALEEQRAEGLEANVNNFEMTIQEEEPKDGYSNSSPIGEGFKIEPESGHVAHRGKRGRRG